MPGMETIVFSAIALAVGLIVGALIGIAYRKKVAEAAIGSAETKAKKIVEDGKAAVETMKKEALIEAKEEWQSYLGCFSHPRTLLLEFMPDGKIETLKREADALRKIAGGM